MKELIDILNSRPAVTLDLPIPEWRTPARWAYVVNHALPFSSNGYAVRTHGVATGAHLDAMQPLVVTRPGMPWEMPEFINRSIPLKREIDGVTYLHLPHPAPFEQDKVARLKLSARALTEAFRVFKPSAVVAASNWENAWPAAVAARECGLPFAYEVRGFWELSRQASDPAWQATPAFHEAVSMETAVANGADRVFTLSTRMRDELVRRGVARSRIDVVPNGVSARPSGAFGLRTSRLDLGLGPGPVVGYIGSFSPYEGLEELLAACARISKEGTNLWLLMVGSSNPVGVDESSDACTVCQALRRQAHELGFADRLVLTGRVPPQAANQLYSLLDLVVVPRRPAAVADLVTPLKPLEAASKGKALLLSDVGALRSLQEVLPATRFFKAGSVDSLAAVMGSLLRDPNELDVLGRANAEAAKRLQWKDVVAPLVAWLTSPSRHVATASKAHEAPQKVADWPRELRLPNSSDLQRTELTEDPVWCEFDMSDDISVRVFADLAYENLPPDAARKALVLVEYLAADGSCIAGPYTGLTHATNVGWYSYLAPASLGGGLLKLVPPRGTVHVRLGFRSFFVKPPQRVTMDPSLRLRWLDNHGAPPVRGDNGPRRQPMLPALPFEQPAVRPKGRLTVASVLDPFSHACFEPDCDLIPVTPAAWRDQISDRRIDLVLVESAWHGNNDAWQYRIAKYAAPPGNEMADLLRWARRVGVPTVFWNKEDPPNFDRFIDRAADFDFIFTTDENCIERYRHRVPSSTYVGALPFAAQPHIHNALLEEPRRNLTSFAGTYYADDFEPRRRAMDLLLCASARHGLDIFDRMHGVSGNEKSRFAFPQDLQPYIRGSLAYEEMLKAYRRYRVALNVNSVSESPTMFSRRVFELLACGTPVVSTESLGIDRMFNGLVPTVESESEAAEALALLMQDARRWLEVSVRGQRAVFKHHTYAHRLQTIARALGIQAGAQATDPVVVAVLPSGHPEQFADNMRRQGTVPQEVIVIGARYADAAAQAHHQALQAVGLRASVLPGDNIATYVRHRHPNAVVALCDSRDHHGPGYLDDAAYALAGTPVFGASTMTAMDSSMDGVSESFGAAAEVGLPTRHLRIATLVARPTEALLAESLGRWLNVESVDVDVDRIRTRAAFDYMPYRFMSAGRDLSRNDLS